MATGGLLWKMILPAAKGVFSLLAKRGGGPHSLKPGETVCVI